MDGSRSMKKKWLQLHKKNYLYGFLRCMSKSEVFQTLMRFVALKCLSFDHIPSFSTASAKATKGMSPGSISPIIPSAFFRYGRMVWAGTIEIFSSNEFKRI